MPNLRSARINDYWRRTFQRSYSGSLERADYFYGGMFDGLTIQLSNGINAFVGKNGTGKSNLMRSLYNCFFTDESNQPIFYNPLLEKSKAELKIIIDGETKEETVIFGETPKHGHEISSFMYDPATLIPKVQEFFCRQDNLNELIEAFEEEMKDDEDIELLNYLTNSEYQYVSVTSIEDEFEDFPSIPFFRVSSQKMSYDSRSMGYGELSLFYLFWLIDHVRKSSYKKAILLLEEPESFLPPLIQERVSNILAMIASENQITSIISTHSEHILRKIPRQNVSILRRVNSEIRATKAEDSIQPLKTLGLSAPQKGLILCEDEAARIFIRSLLKKSSKFVPDSFYIVKCGSHGEISQVLLRLPPYIDNFILLGIIDGGTNVDPRMNTENRKYLFLPGDNGPDILLHDFFTALSLDEKKDCLNATQEAVIEATDLAEGRDAHDYFRVIAESIHEPEESVLLKVADFWVNSRDNHAQTLGFIERIERLAN